MSQRNKRSATTNISVFIFIVLLSASILYGTVALLLSSGLSRIIDKLNLLN